MDVHLPRRGEHDRLGSLPPSRVAGPVRGNQHSRLAVATASYATVFWPVLGASPGAGLAAALIALWSLTLINAHGVRTAGQVQLVTTVLKLLPLAAVGTIGFLYFQPDHFQPFNPTGGSPIGAVTATVTLTMWAFLGLEVATVPAADVHDPKRTIPRATILGTLVAVVVYIACTFAVMGIIAPSELSLSTAPFADAAGSVWGTPGRWIIGAVPPPPARGDDERCRTSR